MSNQKTRRELGRSIGALSVGALAAASGCMKLESAVLDGGTVDVEKTGGTFTEYGVVVIRALVNNSSDEHKDRIVVAKVSVDGGDTQKIRKLATLDAGKSKEFQFRFVFDTRLSESRLNYNVFLK